MIVLLFAIFASITFSQDIDRLSDQVSRGSTEQKRNALGQLRDLHAESASRIAVRALSDPDEMIRATAIGAIIYLPAAEVATALVPMLSDKAEFIRREAAYALGEVRSVDAVGKLNEVVQKDRAPIVRGAAAAALGKIGSEAAVESLTAVLKRSGSDEYLRRAAARSIGQIAERSRFGRLDAPLSRATPGDFLPAKYKKIVATATTPRASAAFQAPLKLLIKAAANRKESDDTRREIAFALGAIGDGSAVPFLQANLNSTDIYLAEICREALLKIGPPK